jgi:type I restriction-modification system DNA methylase subunit
VTTKIPPQEADAISRISGLVLVNAMIFQEILASYDDRVDSLEKVLNEPNLIGSFSEHWGFILEEINYYPIFHLAREILINLIADADIIAALKNLAGTAQRIVNMRAPLRHDLMGRVYHRLLADKKYLGTYYTKIPPANLLLKLALDYDNLSIPWQDLEQISQLRIADLACGTGTLLMAAADAIADNYLRASAEHGSVPNLNDLQRRLAE